MIQYTSDIAVRIAGSQDRQRWDAYALGHPQSSPYHLFAWKLAIEEAYGHSCPYLYGEIGGQIVGILPLVHIRFPGVINELTALPYCDVGACLCDGTTVQDRLLYEAARLRRSLSGKKITLRGHLEESEATRALLHREPSDKVRMLLRLPDSAEALLAGFKSKLRSQVHKAGKNGVVFRWGTMQDLDGFYQVFARNMLDLGSPVHGKMWFRSLLAQYGERIKVGLVEFQGAVVGMGILLLGQKSVSIPWASTLRAYNTLSPNMLLYWKLLEFCADNGFEYFDFGRSTLNEGTYHFKKQWGAAPVPLTWYTMSADSGAAARTTPSRGTARETAAMVWRHLPYPVVNILGPMLRKYISL